MTVLTTKYTPLCTHTTDSLWRGHTSRFMAYDLSSIQTLPTSSDHHHMFASLLLCSSFCRMSTACACSPCFEHAVACSKAVVDSAPVLSCRFSSFSSRLACSMSAFTADPATAFTRASFVALFRSPAAGFLISLCFVLPALNRPWTPVLPLPIAATQSSTQSSQGN